MQTKILVQLRRRLTLLSTLITGAILFAMAFAALRVSEEQLKTSNQMAFQNSMNAIVYRLHMQVDRVLDWAWLAQTEAGDRLIISIEDNGQPLRFLGSWKPLTDRNHLLQEARRIAQEDYQIDIHTKPRSELHTVSANFEVLGQHGERYLAAVVLIPTPPGYKSLTILRDMRDSRINQLRGIFAALALGGAALLSMFCWWFAGRAIRPVEANQKRQAEFIAAASHELRSPLAVIQTSAAALHYGDHADTQRFLSAIERECRRSGRLVDDMLLLASADANAWSLRFAPVNLETLLIETRENYLAMAQKRQHSLILKLPKEQLPPLNGDQQRLQQAISILLDNAIQYTPQGGIITMQARANTRQVVIEVIDNGPGISDEHKKRVFERFFRVDPARHQKEHYGLGLSITGEIVRSHSGKITLHNAKGGGLRAAVSLPLSR